MTQISASLVKELRERTGAGMMDCKNALTENKGDIEAAIDWLRAKGLAKAAKKAGRVAAEGLVGIITNGAAGAAVEVNSETDFVARNEQFQKMVTDITALALDAGGDVAKLGAMTYPGTSHSVEDHIKEMVATIGENMSLRRTAALAVKSGVVSGYVHNKIAEGLGKIVTLVALESDGKADTLAEIGRMIAMHVAAAQPIALDIASVPADVLDREKAILAEKNQGKKPEVLEKIFQSSLKSFAKEKCLIDQPFIHDPSKSVGQVVKEAEKTAGAAITLKDYVFFRLGEGIEKAADDFAEEVKKAAGG